MNFKKYLVILVCFLAVLSIKAQNPFYHQTFEGNSNTAPEIAIIDANNDGVTWQIFGVTTPADLRYGDGHSSFNTAGVNCNGSSDDWMIMPRLRVRKDYIFSFWAQAWNPAKTEQFHLVASKSNDSSLLANYTIKFQDITVNSSANYDENGTPINGSRGQWQLYQFKLSSVAGLSVGDTIFIAFHTDNPNNNSLVIDDILYDSYCPGNISFGTQWLDDPFGNAPYVGLSAYSTALSFNIFTTSLNEIYGPMTAGMSGTLGNDTYSDSYFYYHRLYNYGMASLCQGQVYGMGILGIQYDRSSALYNLQNVRVSAWIDFNGNNTFDSGELVMNQQVVPGNYSYGFARISYFQVPANIPLGNSRLRVRVNWDYTGTADPCVDEEYGQTYDYEVMILPPIPKPSTDAFSLPSNPPKQTTNPSQYITHVQMLPDLDNTSTYLGYSSTVAGVTTNYGYNYSNYTWEQPANLTAGNQATLTITSKSNSCTLGAWIDFDHSGNFTETDWSTGGERIMLKQTSTNTWSVTFTVPATVKDSQEVLLRVRVASYSTGSAMKSNNDLGLNSETEDYRVMFHSGNKVTVPVCAANPFPANVATAVDVNTILLWDQTTDAVGYDVYFGTDNPPTTLVGNSQIANKYVPPASLKPGTTYYWKIVPKNTGGSAVGCSVWSFTTAGTSLTVSCANYVTPIDNGTNVSTGTSLQWTSIPEATSYDVYFGTDNPPATKVSSGQAGTSYTPSVSLLTGTVYYWKVVPKNASGSAINCYVWKFTTVIPVPSCATVPVPSDGTINYANTNPTLSWTGVSDAASYDVYFGTSNPPVAIVSPSQSGTTYSPGTLQYGTTYYWKIGPKNGGGSSTGCPVWSFSMLTPCVPPTLSATANAVSSVYANCPRSMPLGVNLASNSTGGSSCSGNWVYSWSNGSSFWNGSSFSSGSPVYNSAYITISATAADSTNFKVVVQCSANNTCTSQSTVLVIPLKSPASISASIGNPANGTSHYMNVTWSKVNGASYRVDFSLNKATWYNSVFDGKVNSFSFNAGDNPNDSTFFRVKTYLGVESCDYTTMALPKFTACDYPNLTLSNPKGTVMDFTLANEVPVSNPSYTTYSIKCQSCTAPNVFLQNNGTLGSTEVFLTKSAWAVVKSITGLTPSTQYCFYASAKNMDGDVRTLADAGKVCLSSGCSAPVISSQTSGIIYRCAGDTVSFKVKAAAIGTLSYQWVKGGSLDVTGATKSVFSLTNLSKINDENLYTCRVSNSCAVTTINTIALFINTPPTLNVTPLIIHKNICESVTFSVSPQGTPPYSYQWYLASSMINAATSFSYSITCVSANDAGLYSCQVSNKCGFIRSAVSTLAVGSGSVVYGYVTYDNKYSTPLNKTNVSITKSDNTFNNTYQADSSGHYIFNSINPGTYIITGSSSKVWNGGTPLDALIINRYYIGSTASFGDDLKKRAADVNADKHINPTDALTINRRYIGVITKFTAGDWMFSQDTISVSADIQHDFKGICVGDVDGSNVPPLTRLMPDIFIKNNGTININQGRGIHNSGFLLPVKVSRDIDLGAIGLKLRLQTPGIKVTGIKSDIDGLIYNIQDNSQFSPDLSGLNSQLISLAWSALNNSLKLKNGDVLFYLLVEVSNYQLITSNDQLFLVDPLSVLADPQANRYSGETLNIPSLSIDNSQFSIINYPNPFSGITNFEYRLPQSSVVSLKIYNILGIQVAQPVNSVQDAGVYKVSFDASMLPVGAYIYKFEAAGNNQSYDNTELLILSR